MEYAKCLVEVDEILNLLSIEDLQKIPDDIRNSIKEKKDKNYIWKYDESKNLTEQNINRKTIAILSYLNMEYLLNDDQKELMKKLHQINEEKAERIKQEKYNPNELFAKTSNNTIQSKVLLIESRQGKWYDKILNFVKNILRK